MPKISIKRAYQDGHVRVGVELKSGGYRSDDIAMKGSCEISSVEARDLAVALVTEADRVDSVMARREKHSVNRAKWQAREVAAGRMVIMQPSEFFGRTK